MEDVTGRTVAVKTVLTDNLSPPEQVERFDTERRLLLCLHDTHIVPLLATGQEGYVLYLVMPFIPGVTLRSLIAAGSSHEPMRARFPTFETLFTAASETESTERRAATLRPGESSLQVLTAVSQDPRAKPHGRYRRCTDYLRHVVPIMEHVAGAVQHIHASTLSRTGTHVAVVARPMRKEPDGKTDPDGDTTTLAVWNAGSGELVLKLDHKNTVNLVLSPDGSLLAAWDLRRDHCVVPSQEQTPHPFPLGYFADSAAVALDADGRRLACSAGHEARLWDLDKQQLIGHWNLPEGLDEHLAFRGAGRLMLMRVETKSGRNPLFSRIKASDDPRVCRLYDLLSLTPAKAIREISDFDRYVYPIAAAPNGDYYVIEGVGTVEGRPRRLVKVFQGPEGELLGSVSTRLLPGSGSSTALIDPTGKVLGLTLDPGRWTLLDLPSLRSRAVTELNLCCLGLGASRWVAYEQLSSGQQVLGLDSAGETDSPLPGSRCDGYAPAAASPPTGSLSSGATWTVRSLGAT